ncbi:hypothetical protein ACFE04_012624 [Oxalis oulophora]
MAMDMEIDSETALQLVKQGVTLLLLDVPQYTLLGIDTQIFSVGPAFKGIKMIPPGLHFDLLTMECLQVALHYQNVFAASYSGTFESEGPGWPNVLPLSTSRLPWIYEAVMGGRERGKDINHLDPETETHSNFVIFY